MSHGTSLEWSESINKSKRLKSTFPKITIISFGLIFWIMKEANSTKVWSKYKLFQYPNQRDFLTLHELFSTFKQIFGDEKNSLDLLLGMGMGHLTKAI